MQRFRFTAIALQIQPYNDIYEEPQPGHLPHAIIQAFLGALALLILASVHPETIEFTAKPLKFIQKEA